MDNNVVLAVCHALGELGLGSLRFDFRGVAASTGHHGGGTAEVADVTAACAVARTEGLGASPHLVGYSFGAWVALMALQRELDVASAILVAPPVDVLDFDDMHLPGVPSLVVVGDADGFCSVERLKWWLSAHPGQPGELVVLPGVDHFYQGDEPQLQATIRRFLTAETAAEDRP
jgi:alpha/beta superfamily hydrolase